MAKVAKVVAAPGSLPSDSLDFCGGAMNARPVVKRKTPSELRGEQLKRRFAAEVVHESAASPELREVDSVIKKSEGTRNTRYVDTRLDEVYPSIKPTSRLSLLSVKSNSKANQTSEVKGAIKSSLPLHFTLKSHQEQNDKQASVAEANDSVPHQTSGKDSQSRFRSVAELSLGSDRFSQMGTVDMEKVLRGLVTRETSAFCSAPNVSGKSGDVKSATLANFCSELLMSGRKVPLDLTLKTSMRVVSSHPVNRFHRLLMGDTYNGEVPFSFRFGFSGSQNISSASNSPASTDSCSFNSWIYPQSLFPPSIMSVLSSSAGGVETDFLNKRKLAWEDSFRSLYYMLRKSKCDIFYVCTSQFVVVFTAFGSTGNSKRICNAYISQSTRGLRSLLEEHDISFSMPLCCSEVEQISREDLVELSEIEKQNLGQAKRTGSMPDLDNSPQSLLAFNGNDSVHGLYDLLLNYRSLLSTLSTLTSADVPLLCAPIPFLHAAVSSPEVRCKEIKRLQLKGLVGKDDESNDGSTSGISYSIEIKDAYLPPWVVCSLCAALGSYGKSFEASFVTELSSMGLNAALEAIIRKSDKDETSGDSQEVVHVLGIPTAVVKSDLQSASLKSLKYSDGSYIASLSPI